eukprot:gene4055-3114_t
MLRALIWAVIFFHVAACAWVNISDGEHDYSTGLYSAHQAG